MFDKDIIIEGLESRLDFLKTRCEQLKDIVSTCVDKNYDSSYDWAVSEWYETSKEYRSTSEMLDWVMWDYEDCDDE